MNQKKILHIGIIPDGNRRWAREKNLAIWKGHSRALESSKLKSLIDISKKYNIKYLTFWGFSTENWKRSFEEKEYLFKLFEKAIEDFSIFFNKEDIKFRHIGRKDRFPKKLLYKIQNLEKQTKNNKSFNFSVCLDYGGRDEIIRAVNKIINSGIKKVNEEVFKSFLDTRELPYLDIIIRTSGEKRLSGFFPFQGAYAELFFVKKYFPDFSEKDFEKIIKDFNKRDRRFGGD